MISLFSPGVPDRIRRSTSKCPGAVFEYLLLRPVAERGNDREVGRADHKVLVNHRVIDAGGGAFLARHVRKAAQRVGIPLAERQVADCVFVKQRVVEQIAELIDGR